MRTWAPESYSYWMLVYGGLQGEETSVLTFQVLPRLGFSDPIEGRFAWCQGQADVERPLGRRKLRFCASYPNVGQVRAPRPCGSCSLVAFSGFQ